MNKPMQRAYKASERVFKYRHDSLVKRPITRRNLADSRHQRAATIPEFLLPSFAPQRSIPRSSTSWTPAFQNQTCSSIPYQHGRQFSTTARQKSVVVAANPRKDDEGNDMLVDITPRAANVCSTKPSFLIIAA